MENIKYLIQFIGVTDGQGKSLVYLASEEGSVEAL